VDQDLDAVVWDARTMGEVGDRKIALARGIGMDLVQSGLVALEASAELRMLREQRFEPLAVADLRPSAPVRHPFVVALRDRLVEDGSLQQQGDHLVFSRDVEFTSPSAAASSVHGGGANGLTAWKNRTGKTLKELEGG
jgi:hypothetical protein